MKTELTDVTGCKKNLDIEIPQDVVDAEISHIAQDFARRARVPGFRPGKAPIGVVKTRLRDEILSEMMQHLMPKYFGDAIDERKLDIVQAPHLESIDYDAGKALHAAAKAAGEFGYGAQWAGQGAPLARAEPAAELVARLRVEMQTALSAG